MVTLQITQGRKKTTQPTPTLSPLVCPSLPTPNVWQWSETQMTTSAWQGWTESLPSCIITHFGRWYYTYPAKRPAGWKWRRTYKAIKVCRQAIRHHKNAEGLLNLHTKPALFNETKMKLLCNWGWIAEEVGDSQREPFIHKTNITLKHIGCEIHRKRALVPSVPAPSIRHLFSLMEAQMLQRGIVRHKKQNV